MIKELIIHLGDRKTGSTSIQGVLASRGWRCETADIVYPSRANHCKLARAITANNKEFLQKRGPEIRQRLLRSKADFGVISAEDFEVANPLQLSKFVDNYLPEFRSSMRLIAYIRPHADRLLSSFAERVKSGTFFGGLNELHEYFLSKRFLTYLPRLQAWRDVFAGQVTFRVFKRDHLHNLDVVQDFLTFVLGNNIYCIDGAIQRNQSLCIEDLVMLREAHRTMIRQYGDQISRSSRIAFGKSMGRLLATQSAKGTPLRLHHELADRVHDAYLQDALALDANFFTDQPMTKSLRMEHTNSPVHAQQLEASLYFSPAEIGRIRCWAELIGGFFVSKSGNPVASLMPSPLSNHPLKN